MVKPPEGFVELHPAEQLELPDWVRQLVDLLVLLLELLRLERPLEAVAVPRLALESYPCPLSLETCRTLQTKFVDRKALEAEGFELPLSSWLRQPLV